MVTISTLLGYIGPGPGLSMIGALIGLIVTIFSALAAVLLWPMRKLLKSAKSGEEDDESADTEAAADGGAEQTDEDGKSSEADDSDEDAEDDDSDETDDS